MEASSSRRSYTIKKKLDILREYEPKVTGKGFLALSKKHNIPVSTLRGWYARKRDLEAAVGDKNIECRLRRRLDGGGRKPSMVDIEENLMEWIRGRNNSGLRVRDKYITIKARELLKERLLQLSSDEERNESTSCDFSKRWLQRFKQRYDLVARRVTTERSLPIDAPEQAELFILRIQTMIEKLGVKEKNIFNLDQVPRYFETSGGSTITVSGARNVKIRRGSSSHKRMTVSFIISARGEMLKPHVLFSNLKNKPKVDADILIDVNSTGMCCNKIILGYLKETICKRREIVYSVENQYCSYSILMAHTYLLKRVKS